MSLTTEGIPRCSQFSSQIFLQWVLCLPQRLCPLECTRYSAHRKRPCGNLAQTTSSDSAALPKILLDCSVPCPSTSSLQRELLIISGSLFFASLLGKKCDVLEETKRGKEEDGTVYCALIHPCFHLSFVLIMRKKYVKEFIIMT